MPSCVVGSVKSKYPKKEGQKYKGYQKKKHVLKKYAKMY